MDAHTEAGRGAFIGLIVNWSFCSEDQLGYDSSVRYLNNLGCWEIAVPGGSIGDTDNSSSSIDTVSLGSTEEVFYSSTILLTADRMFGRHTRCFIATEVKPTERSCIKMEDCDTLIKDAWLESVGDGGVDPRNEVAHLHDITQTLKHYQELAGTYPELKRGGLVRLQQDSDNTFTEDTTLSILGDLFSNLVVGNKKEQEHKPQLRVHRRVAMSPIGKPLNMLKSVPELIIVVADAMRAHRAIVEHCHILHRDVMPGNILFRRMNDGTVKGMLVDFDHAAQMAEMLKSSIGLTAKH
ncbi:hypothetical protein GGF37_004667 [Kickxella alabastrina]|nr:hypothetical protein GGF37_004667 [Kickxella alabastrina]